MQTVSDIFTEYSKKLDHLDLELLISHVIEKSREFVLAHPEYKLTETQILNLKSLVRRRQGKEPVAYIIGKKEFFGFDFEVNRHTLTPRPETEMLVEETVIVLRNMLRNTIVVDIGTGSGNIIISVAKEIERHHKTASCKFYGIDLSKQALAVAKRNAKKHTIAKKITFLHGNLLEPLLKKLKSNIKGQSSIVITANLPYLSKEVYESAPIDVKKFEPKSALYSSDKGLSHYKKLFTQIKKLRSSVNCQVLIVLEFSPEQKNYLLETITGYFPKAETTFQKDLSGKWRLARIHIS